MKEAVNVTSKVRIRKFYERDQDKENIKNALEEYIKLMARNFADALTPVLAARLYSELSEHFAIEKRTEGIPGMVSRYGILNYDISVSMDIDSAVESMIDTGLFNIKRNKTKYGDHPFDDEEDKKI